MLGHGAGGGVDSPDLAGAASAASDAGLTVALVEQPYRVAGRRSPPPAQRLDEAWLAVVEQLREGPLRGLPLLAGGRSAGAPRRLPYGRRGRSRRRSVPRVPAAPAGPPGADPLARA